MKTTNIPIATAIIIAVGSVVPAAAAERVFERFDGHPSGQGAFGFTTQTYGGLTSDRAGNLYGTTPNGGTSTWCQVTSELIGCGTAFELSPPAAPGGAWTTTTLYSFAPTGSGDFVHPAGGMVRDSAGNLYGTAVTGQGANEPGGVFELSPPTSPDGTWTEKLIYVFGANGSTDGYNANGNLVADGTGNLYGTTNEGGAFLRGVVFRLSPPAVAGGAWTETVLYAFGSSKNDGQYPLGGVILDEFGNLYGSTSRGGPHGQGTLFALVPPSSPGGAWTEKPLHAFAGGADGGAPIGSLTLYQSALYGADSLGVFQWTSSGLSLIGGPQPSAGLIVDSVGNLYGTSYGLGANNLGFVFELSPPVLGVAAGRKLSCTASRVARMEPILSRA